MRITETAKLHVQDKVPCTANLVSIRCVNQNDTHKMIPILVCVFHQPVSNNASRLYLKRPSLLARIYLFNVILRGRYNQFLLIHPK